MYNDTNVNRTFIHNQEHNTIDLNNLYSNRQNNINKKYNMKRPPSYSTYNYNYNKNQRKEFEELIKEIDGYKKCVNKCKDVGKENSEQR